MMFSKLIVLAQMGSTIAIGLLVDTLIVRSLLMPSIATHAGPVVLVAASRLPPRRLSIPEAAAATSAEGRPGPTVRRCLRGCKRDPDARCRRLRDSLTSRGLSDGAVIRRLHEVAGPPLLMHQ